MGWLWEDRATEAVLEFLQDTMVGCMHSGSEPPGEGGGRQRARVKGGGLGGWAGSALGCIFLSLDLSFVSYFSFPSSVSLLVSFLSPLSNSFAFSLGYIFRATGKQEKRELL